MNIRALAALHKTAENLLMILSDLQKIQDGVSVGADEGLWDTIDAAYDAAKGAYDQVVKCTAAQDRKEAEQ